MRYGCNFPTIKISQLFMVWCR